MFKAFNTFLNYLNEYKLLTSMMIYAIKKQPKSSVTYFLVLDIMDD
jgi:hypothetical protein